MAPKRRADSIQSSPMSVSRRRSTLRELQASTPTGDVITKVIDARPSLEKAEMYGIDDPRPASSRMMGLLGRIFIETIPQWLAVGAMLGLIFGGCCSNVSNAWGWMKEWLGKEAYTIYSRFLLWKPLSSRSLKS